MINLSSPVIKWAQQRANRSWRTMVLIKNCVGGIDIVDQHMISIDDNGGKRNPFAIVHPQDLDVARATV